LCILCIMAECLPDRCVFDRIGLSRNKSWLPTKAMHLKAAILNTSLVYPGLTLRLTCAHGTSPLVARNSTSSISFGQRDVHWQAQSIILNRCKRPTLVLIVYVHSFISTVYRQSATNRHQSCIYCRPAI